MLDSRLQAQNQAQKKYGYGAIYLARIGNYAIVSVEHNGMWIEVIRELLDSNYSHIVEPLGIASRIEEFTKVKTA